MKVIRFQRRDGIPVPFDEVDKELWAGYKENQITTHKVTGVRKPRSYDQLKMFHAVLKDVARNSQDHNWNSVAKAKFSLKVQLHYIKDDVVVVDKQGGVHFQYRSFGYEGLEHMEANRIFDRAWPILADVIGVTVEELLKNAGKAA